MRLHVYFCGESIQISLSSLLWVIIKESRKTDVGDGVFFQMVMNCISEWNGFGMRKM